MKQVFYPADILLPRDVDMEKWSVVACDQFTSQPEYWDALERRCAGTPSTLHMIFPEAYLETRDRAETAAGIRETMLAYLRDGLFRLCRDSYVLVERTLPSGILRRGLVGALDLEDYDYRPDARTPVRATEGTVESRLPPRVAVRQGAALELPHAMVFADDPGRTVIEPLYARRETLPLLYDFDLCAGGGHLRGWQVSGRDAAAVDAALAALAAGCGEGSLRFAVGDGNHSLATAKRCWELTRAGLSPEERLTHPARRSLVELVNLRDDSIVFEPIHRALANTDPSAFLREAREVFAERYRQGEQAFTLRTVTGEGEETLLVSCGSIGELIALAEEFMQRYGSAHGGTLDYIHNDEAALALGRRPGGAALLLPAMKKDGFFSSVEKSGPFPRKSFSIGLAEDKRYYLECRRIVPEAAVK